MSTIPKRYSVKSGSRQSIDNTRNAIRQREPFQTSGALRAAAGIDTGWGRLWGEAQERFIADRASIDYVVVSYDTPIAWHTTAGIWVVVRQRFSVTTGTHQSAVQAALNGRLASGPIWQIDPIAYVTVGDAA